MTTPHKLLGQQINQYRIVRHIARGGMADVYLAKDVDLEREVAFKVMLDALAATDSEFVERFRREAKIVAKLDHPSIVQIYTIGQTAVEQPYIAMQYIEGGSLQEKLKALADRRKLLTTEQALNIIRQITLALNAAHEAGIIHRDLKPANVLIRPDGTPVLVDLGIATIQGGAKLTQTGGVIGTPAYMAPEQVRGGGLDGRADLYALGIMLYEMLTGIRPFEADSSIAVLHKQVYEEPLPLSSFRSDLTAQTLQLVTTAMQKEPANRYQSATEMVRAIDNAIQAEGLYAPNPQATIVLTQMNDSALLSRSRIVQPPRQVENKNPVQKPEGKVARFPVPLWAMGLSAFLIIALLAFFAFRNVTDDTPTANGGVVETAVSEQVIMPTQIIAPTETAASEQVVVPTETAVSQADTPSQPTVTLIVPTETPPTANTALGGGTGVIVYAEQTAQGRAIVIYNLETGAKQQITQNSVDNHGPIWSPDGQLIAYTSEEGDQFDIFTINVNTGATRNLTNHPGDDAYPSWSPDGSQLLFHSNRNGDFDIFAINADGTGLRQLTSNDLPDLGPTWSPNGRQIAFTQAVNNHRQITIMNVDGSDIYRITSDGSYSHSYPSWSPDGQQLTFYMVPDLSLTSGIYVIDINGQNMRQLTQNEDFEPAWSPDGEWILFHRKSSGNRILHHIRPDGTELTAISTNASDARDGDWQP